MPVAGNIYGVVLNDRDERTALGASLREKPYGAPPVAPVLYMKPLSALSSGTISMTAGEVMRASATFALLFARDASRCGPQDAWASVGAVALALDLSLPQADYYRPAIGQAIRDGSLVLGEWCAPVIPNEIRTAIDGAGAHQWTMDRLVRDPLHLIADISAFMTLRAGDVLLVGLPGDAPMISHGQSIIVSADGLPLVSAIAGGAA
ncbi:MAG: hypothetical protein RIS85_2722 [Pseudomonadota bacterium]